MLHPHMTLNCGGTLISLESPLVMGILNATPDSFYDGSRYQRVDQAIRHCEKMIREGATFIDIGGLSTRPGAASITMEEESERVIPVIKAVHAAFPKVILSIDTFWSEIAVRAVEAGASMVNDISAGGFDARMFQTVATLDVPYVLMHMQGSPANMQEHPVYTDVVEEVLDFLIRKAGQLREMGTKDIILDPGFGFGKSLDHNYQLLNKLHVMRILEYPVLVGLSRKSMICKVLKVNPGMALNGTTALHMVALQQGAKILRTHDVREAVEVIKLWQYLENIKD